MLTVLEISDSDDGTIAQRMRDLQRFHRLANEKFGLRIMIGTVVGDAESELVRGCIFVEIRMLVLGFFDSLTDFRSHVLVGIDEQQGDVLSAIASQNVIRSYSHQQPLGDRLDDIVGSFWVD